MSRPASVHVAVLQVELALPACRTLKDKRSALKSLLISVQREFACSAAELGWLDDPSRGLIGCSVIGNDGRHVERVVQKIPGWIERHRPDLEVVDFQVEAR